MAATTTTTDSCSNYYTDFEEFTNQVKKGIKKSVNQETQTSGSLKKKFKKRVTKTFDRWYKDVARESKVQQCLTDNLHGKDGVFE